MGDRKKVVLEYDEVSGEIYSKDGINVGSWMNLVHFGEHDDQGGTIPVREVVKLKEAGFTAEDIVTMFDAGAL